MKGAQLVRAVGSTGNEVRRDSTGRGCELGQVFSPGRYRIGTLFQKRSLA